MVNTRVHGLLTDIQPPVSMEIVINKFTYLQRKKACFDGLFLQGKLPSKFITFIENYLFVEYKSFSKPKKAV